MVTASGRGWVAGGVLLCIAAPAVAQQAGSIRGVVYDKDFNAPLPNAIVEILGTGERVVASDDGVYNFREVPAGTYTLAFSKDGYTRLLRPNVIVAGGRVEDVEAFLAGDFTDMDEFVVSEVQLGGSESALLQLRLESPALLDSIGSELMSRAGASDAAQALRFIPGATVADGRFAVIRGLPPRYVSSQLNGVVLPSADAETRAVPLDLYPAAVIESIQVSKTFTPDQQGDASGGAVNLLLKSIPEEALVRLSFQTSMNSQVRGAGDNFLSYDGGGVDRWGSIGADRAVQTWNLGKSWNGAIGTSTTSAPTDFKWNGSIGSRHEFDNGVTIGGFADFFYERDSAYFDNGISDSWWVIDPGGPMVPKTSQGAPVDGDYSEGDYKTSLYNVTQGEESVQWGGLATVGLETERNKLSLTYLYSRTTTDTATLGEDTRGKSYAFPDYDVSDPLGPGNRGLERATAPWTRVQTLSYVQDQSTSIQLRGKHILPFDAPTDEGLFVLLPPELDWTFARSKAETKEPDKRQFASQWWAESLNPGFPPFVPPFSLPATYLPYKPAANFNLGNAQHIFQSIEEESKQFFVNFKMPFKQWTETEGFFKFGFFQDTVDRTFTQQTFSNFGDNAGYAEPDFRNFWSSVWPDQDHPITGGPPFVDVDYDGRQKIQAWYGMVEVPIVPEISLIGGARYESTSIGIQNFPEEDATWLPPGASAPVSLNPGDADVDYDQDDVLPALAIVLRPIEWTTIRGSWSRTVARPVFRELTPILQQEFLGGDIFIGNPELTMSSVENFDLRLDLTPLPNGLFSISWFDKEITDPIEYVQRVQAGFDYTFPVNFPKATIRGWEVELRQDLGQVNELLTGLTLGANATFIDSRATLPADEAAAFSAPNINVPTTFRPVTGAPEYLYNLFCTYDVKEMGTSFSLFYTVQGDTLVAGAAESDGNYVPDVYLTERGILNLTIGQQLGKYFKATFQAKNLTNSPTTTVYRSPVIGDDVVRTYKTSGIDYSLSVSAQFTF